MGGIADLIVALSLVGFMQEREAREEVRTSRQEEVFVPFNFSPLEPQLTKEAKLPVAAPASSSEALPFGV
jgi:hypothetical protein